MIDGVNDKIAGAHSELVVKVYGNDFAEMRRIAERDRRRCSRTIPGAADVAIDQEPPLPQLQIHVDREAAARFGINVSDISDLIEIGIGGKPVGAGLPRRAPLRRRRSASSRPCATAPRRSATSPSLGHGDARIPLSQVAEDRAARPARARSRARRTGVTSR